VIIERQLEDYGRHLDGLITDLEIPFLPAQPVRPVTADQPMLRRRWLIAATGVATLVVIALVVLVRSGTGTEPTPSADQGPPVLGGVDRVTPTSSPTEEGGSATLERAPVQLGGEAVFTRSGDTLWAWQGEGDGQVVGYRDGEWVSLPPLPGTVLDVTGDQEGPVWAVTRISRSLLVPDRAVWSLEDGMWLRIHDERLIDAAQIEVDEATGIVWVATSNDLFSWDEKELIRRESPPQGMVLDSIAVTGDGTVWATRFNPFFDHLPAGLVRYHPDTGAWEWVRPLGGSENVPAVLAPTPEGDLWVLLEDYEGPVAPVLAHFDSVTEEWTVHALPEGWPWQWSHGQGNWTADDETFWVARSSASEGARWVLRFDGLEWTTFPVHRTISTLGIGGDGTVWVSYGGGLYRLIIDEAAVP
jgi:hypothetical protein